MCACVLKLRKNLSFVGFALSVFEMKWLDHSLYLAVEAGKKTTIFRSYVEDSMYVNWLIVEFRVLSICSL